MTSLRLLNVNRIRTWNIKLITVIISIWLIVGITAMAAEVITIKVEGEAVIFTDVYGLPFIDGHNRTQVPVRQILETYGAKVVWNDDDRIVEVTYQSIFLEIPIGRSEIIKNGTCIPIESASLIQDGRTYLPIRSVIEALGGEVCWESEDQAVLIYHHQGTEDSTITDTDLLGLSEDEVMARYGEPDLVVASTYGFDWWIYRNDYDGYKQLGLYDKTLEAIYVTKAEDVWPYKIGIGMTLKEVQAYGITRSRGSWTSYGNLKMSDDVSSASDGDTILWPFIDDYNHNRIYALLAIRSDYNSRWIGDTTSMSTSANEEQIIELTNVFRVANGLPPLMSDEALSKVARDHSEDMQDKNYFSHTNQQGDSPFDRMNDDGIDYVMAGENIAVGQTNAINVMDAWLNSENHRDNMLLDFNYIGAGVSDDLYYTLDFIKAP